VARRKDHQNLRENLVQLDVRGMVLAGGGERETIELRPEARLGAALRAARERQGLSLRGLARRLYRSHSNLVEYERGHRLAPLDVVEAYEAELGAARGSLVAVHELAHLELYGEDRLRRPSPVRKASLPALHQLPADIPDFTGRESELARLRGIVAGNATQGAAVVISAIAGMAGVGKTALVVHLGHELGDRFPDAQLFVDLHGYDPLQRLAPEEALDWFLRSLGVTSEALPTTVDRQAAVYRSLLAGRRALVVLDNASSAEQVRPLLPGSPTCLVLITSRSSLVGLAAAQGARLVSLDVLGPAEALELLARVAGQDGRERVGREPDAAVKVTRLCGHLPLGVRIAAAALAARPSLSVAELARRLGDEQQRLGQLASGDVEVRASFAFSYQNLDLPVARMFRRLGLIPGPDFARGVAAALSEIGPVAAERFLETLVDAHLVEAAATPDRYRFHDLLRLYSREQAQAEETDLDRKAALQRMLEWYLDSARAAARLLEPGRRLLSCGDSGERPEPTFATHAQAMAWFEAERANLVAANHQAANSGLHTIAWLLPNALFGYFDLRKHWADWEKTHTVGLTAAQAAPDRRAQAWMMGSLGTAHIDLRRFEEAIDSQQQALAIMREVGDRWGEGAALGNLGAAYNRLQRPEEAIVCLQQALLIFREAGYRRNEGMALHNLGEASQLLRQFAEAIDYGHQALAIFREVGNRHREGMVLNDIGNAYRELGRFDEAIDCLEEALTIHRDVGSRWGEGRALQFLGLAFQCTPRADEARACWQEALTIFTELGAPEADDVRCLVEE
jgi:tetratricopeptide (TPR) repeat protein/transcriptional regulator with XRE-family HTH domain